MTCIEKLLSAVERENEGNGTTPERWRTVLLTSIADSLAVIADKLTENENKDRPTGEWIRSNIPCEEYVCSKCGGACWYYDVEKVVARSRFCPNCGAKMK